MRTFLGVGGACVLLWASSCGPDDPKDTMIVTAELDGTDVVFSWATGPELPADPRPAIGTLAVYRCYDGRCPQGAYRDSAADDPVWYLVREDYTECTFPQLLPEVVYGESPPPALGTRATDVGPAPLEPSMEYVAVVFRYGGCLSGGPLHAGRTVFVAP